MIQFHKLMALSSLILITAACTQSVSADSEHACEAASPASIADHFGVDASVVTEEVFYESRDKKSTTDCLWRFVDSEGHQTLVNYRKTERTEKIGNPSLFSTNIDYLIQNGQKIGSKTVTYSAQELAGIDNGAISQVFGNRFTKELAYLWRIKEERLKKVSLARNVNDAGELSEPSEEELAKLVLLFQ